MSDDLAAFLRARLDEDEAAANKVHGLWRAHGGRSIADDSYAALLIADVDPDTRAYILRHDPARVLREVAAKRAILARHQPYPLDRWQMCGACCTVEHFEFTGAELSSVRWPCPDVRHLAAVYSDHPDYRQEWKP